MARSPLRRGSAAAEPETVPDHGRIRVMLTLVVAVLVLGTTLVLAVFLAPVLFDPRPSVAGGQAVVAVLMYLGVVALVLWLAGRLRSSEGARTQAQARYESAFEASPLPIVTLDPDGRVEDVNGAFGTWSGYAADDVRGRPFQDLVAVEDRSAAEAAFARVGSGQATQNERLVIDGHGRRRAVTAITLPLRGSDGRRGSWTLLQDVTGEPTPVESLRASEERYRRLVENLPAVVYHAPPGYYTGDDPLWFVSPGIEAWLGYPMTAWLSDPRFWQQVIHRDDWGLAIASAAAGHPAGTIRRVEYRVFTSDGTPRWVLDQAHPVLGPEGEPGWVQGVLVDITAEKAFEQQLAERVSVQHTLAWFARSALVAEDFDELAQLSLDAATTLSGAAAATLYSRVGDSFEPTHSRGWPAGSSPSEVTVDGVGAVADALRGKIGDFDADGALAGAGFQAGLAVPVGRRSAPHAVLAVHDVEPRSYSGLERDALSILSGFVSSALDHDATLGALRRSEAEATSRTDRLSALIDASPLAIVEVAVDGTIIGHNPATEYLLGLGDDDHGARLPDEFADIAPVLEQLIGAAAAGRVPPPVEVTTELLTRGPTVLQLHAAPRSVSPDERDAVIFVVDVTERRLLETHLSHVDKMEALGRLAGGIAHDFNNLLTVIGGYADLARESDDLVSIRADLDGIADATADGAGLVRGFLGAAGDQQGEVEPVDLPGVIAADLAFYERALPAGVTLTRESDDPCPPVFVGLSDLRRMLLNLITNAADAVADDNGEVFLSCSCDDEIVTVSVRDEGEGMDHLTALRVFEPFFTTKADRGGTGLGLFTVYRLAQAYGGRVDIDSEPGRGTRVAITFPAASCDDEGTVTPDRARQATASPTRTGSILLVEDEDGVRALTQRILTDAGHDVAAVSSGEAAVAALETRRFDLLLSDLVLPGISGTAVAGAARRLQPGIAVILLSGYTSAIALRQGIRLGGLELLPKPFSSHRLLERIDDALEGARALTVA